MGKSAVELMDEPRSGGAERDGGRTPPTPAPSRFEIYKPGHGYWVRMCTGVAGGLIVAAGAHFLFRQLEVYRTDEAWTLWLQIGIPLLFAAVAGYALFWAVGVNRKSCDFMIATEGEMKKVSWSNRREVWGSTKVVIFFTLMMGFLLFGVDLLFLAFFSAIGVLQGPSPLQALFGTGS